MEAIYLLIPLAALLVVVIVAGFLWAVKSGQFDDLEGPAHSILMDDDDPAHMESSKPGPGKKSPGTPESQKHPPSKD
jgi:cbb3-type cytochrome oxidase maturation protein